jgi:hypothetical protein
MGHWLQPTILDTTDSIQQQMAEEPQLATTKNYFCSGEIYMTKMNITWQDMQLIENSDLN